MGFLLRPETTFLQGRTLFHVTCLGAEEGRDGGLLGARLRNSCPRESDRGVLPFQNSTGHFWFGCERLGRERSEQKVNTCH